MAFYRDISSSPALDLPFYVFAILLPPLYRNSITIISLLQYKSRKNIAIANFMCYYKTKIQTKGGIFNGSF